MALGTAYGIDVVKENYGDKLYLSGNEFVDGSLRAIPDLVTGENFELQLRTNGVWNDTGLQIAASTVFLGRDLELKGAGDWVHTTDIQGDHKALVPHIEFTDAGGTVQSGHMPILTPLIENFPIQTDFSQEIVTQNYTVTQINPAELLAKRAHYKTGSVAATQPVNISYERPLGTIFWTQNFPASRFPANTDVTIELKGLLEGFTNEEIITVITSVADFSLLGDLAGTAYTLLDFYLLSEEQIMTSTTGMDRILTDQTSEVLVDITGDLILSGEAP
jgi:hypothetical protein